MGCCYFLLLPTQERASSVNQGSWQVPGPPRAGLSAVYVNSSKHNFKCTLRALGCLMQEILSYSNSCPAKCLCLPCRRCVGALLGWRISWHRCRQFARQIARATSLAGRNCRWAVHAKQSQAGLCSWTTPVWTCVLSRLYCAPEAKEQAHCRLPNSSWHYAIFCLAPVKR